jgi:hypothetical protein
MYAGSGTKRITKTYCPRGQFKKSGNLPGIGRVDNTKDDLKLEQAELRRGYISRGFCR